MFLIDLVERGDELEQEIIKRYKLNKAEAFYVFSGKDGTVRDRLNEIFEIRGEPWFIPDDEHEKVLEVWDI